MSSETKETPPAVGLSLAILVVVMFAGLGFGVKLFRTNAQLRAELTSLRKAAETATAPAAALSPADDREEIAREKSLLHAAEAKAVEIGRTLPRMSEEEWRSLGRVEELGEQAADFLREMSDLFAAAKSGDTWNFMPEFMAWLKKLSAIGEMEDDPPEIARLHAAALAARLKLSADIREQVRQQIEKEFVQLNAMKLARPQRPESDREDWYARRDAALNEASALVEALIPESQRVPFAAAQTLHLGTGARTNTEVQADGHGSVSLGFFLPGLTPSTP